MNNRFIVIRHGRKTLVAEMLPGSADTAHVVADCFSSEHNACKLRDAMVTAWNVAHQGELVVKRVVEEA